MSEELSWELYDLFDSERYAFPIYDHASARRIVRYLLYRGILDEEIADAIEDSTADLRLWLDRAGKAMVGEWVIAWVNEVNDEYRRDKERRGSILPDHHDPDGECYVTDACKQEHEDYSDDTASPRARVSSHGNNDHVTRDRVTRDYVTMKSSNGIALKNKRIKKKFGNTLTLPVVTGTPQNSVKRSMRFKDRLTDHFETAGSSHTNLLPLIIRCNSTNSLTELTNNSTTASESPTETSSKSAPSVPSMSSSDIAVDPDLDLHSHRDLDSGTFSADFVPENNADNTSCQARATTAESTNQSHCVIQQLGHSLTVSSPRNERKKQGLDCSCSISHYFVGEEMLTRDRKGKVGAKRKGVILGVGGQCKSHRSPHRPNAVRRQITSIDFGFADDDFDEDDDIRDRLSRRRHTRAIDDEYDVMPSESKQSANVDEPGYIMVFSDAEQSKMAGKELYKIVASADPNGYLNDLRLRHSDAAVVWQVKVRRTASALIDVNTLLKDSNLYSNWFKCPLEVIIDAVSTVAAADRNANNINNITNVINNNNINK